jgi:hypothetical protein
VQRLNQMVSRARGFSHGTSRRHARPWASHPGKGLTGPGGLVDARTKSWHDGVRAARRRTLPGSAKDNADRPPAGEQR